MEINDIDFIESIDDYPVFTPAHWKKLRKDLENFIEHTDKKTGEVTKPFQDCLNYYTFGTDVSDKVAVSALFLLLSLTSNPDQKIYTFQGTKKLVLWWLIIGMSGVARKSAMIDRNKDIIEAMNASGLTREIVLHPDNFTAPKLIINLSEEPQQCLLADEISKIFKTGKKEHSNTLGETLSQVYDCPREVVQDTVVRGTERIMNPYVVIGGGTQPRTAFVEIGEDIMSQGLMMRWNYILEFEKENYRRMSPSKQVYNQYMQKAVDFATILTGSTIQDFYYKNTSLLEKYLHDVEIIERNAYKDIMSSVFPYYARVIPKTLKMAALLENAKQCYFGNTSTTVTIQDDAMNIAVRAMRMYEQEFRQFVKTMRTTAQSKEVETDDEAQRYVLEKIISSKYGIITTRDLIKATKYNRNKLREITDTLLESEEIGSIVAPKVTPGRGSPPKIYYYRHGALNLDDDLAEVYYLRKNGKINKAIELEQRIEDERL